MMTSRRPTPRLHAHAGVTLIEILVATMVLGMVSLMLFNAFSSTADLRTRLAKRQEREHIARIAMSRIGRDIRSAFLSAHINLDQRLNMVSTAFVGQDQSSGDRLDLTTFSHRRLMRAAHEGDACEVGYRVEARKTGGGYDLLRRESPRIDADPQKGGTTDVFVPDIKLFELRYYDSTTDAWLDAWDSTQSSQQFGRLPARVRIRMRVGERGSQMEFDAETSPMIADMLRFGLPLDFK